MIPKIVHYIWFGDQAKKPVERIDNWKRLLPDYTFMEWNESNLDISTYAFGKLAYDFGSYAPCSDALRFEVLEKYGGVWFDCDVDLYKDFSELLNGCSFLLGCTYSRVLVNIGLMAMEPHHPIVIDTIKWYKEHWTKCTLTKEPGNFSSFITTYEARYLPEDILRGRIFARYKIMPPGISKDFDTPDGALRFKAPNVFTTREKDHLDVNYAHHLFQASWWQGIPH